MRARALLARIVLGAVLPALPSCSLLVDTNADQCSVDADCAAKGGRFAGTRCVDRACVAAPAASGCTTNADCAATSGGAPAICKADKTCEKLTSQDCQDVSGDATAEGAIVYGFLGPLTGEFASQGVPVLDAVKLAFTEIGNNAGGIPSPNGGKPRSIALVACHDQDDPIRAAQHLVDIGVPAVIGPQFSGDVIKVATMVTIPAGMLLLTPSATATSIATLPNRNDLVWRTCPSDAIQAQALSDLVPEVEANVRAAYKIADATKIKVAMTVKGDAYGTGLADAVIAKLRFNGVSASDNQGYFVRKDYPDPPTPDTNDYGSIVNAVISPSPAPPSIVLLLGTTEAVTKILAGIEAAIASMNPAPPKPFYVLSDGGEVPELVSMIGTSDDLRKRIVGTVPGHDNPTRQAFAQRFMGVYDTAPGLYADNGYDAAYLLVYATAAAGSSITGATLAAGMKKLVPPSSTKIVAGPGDVNMAFGALGSGGTIDYDGASGPLDFDVTKGEAPADIDVWCISRMIGTGTPAFASSGQYWDATKGALVGTPSCP